MKDINALIALLALAALLLASGCASSRHNTTYASPPVDPTDYASPHSVP